MYKNYITQNVKSKHKTQNVKKYKKFLKKVLTKYKMCYNIKTQNVKEEEKMEMLKKFRISLGLTIQGFAETIGVSKSLYEKVESGVRKPSREFTTKLKTKYPQFDVNNFFTTQ